MANWYVGSVDYTAVAQFAVSHAYVIGNLIRQLAAPAAGNQRVFRCTTAGTSASTEPVWTLTAGSTTTSGTATFTEVTGQQAYQASGAWAAPHAVINNAMQSGWAAEGDTIYVAKNHAETSAAQIKFQMLGSNWLLNQVICVDNTASGSVPPTAANWFPAIGTQNTNLGASVTMTNTASQITFNDPSNNTQMYWYGISFISSYQINSSNNGMEFWDNCYFSLTSTADANKTGGPFTYGFTWNNCTFNFGATTAHNSFGGGIGKVINPKFQAGTTYPTRFYNTPSACEFHIIDGDFTGWGSNYIINQSSQTGTHYLENCKLATNAIPVGVAGDDGKQGPLCTTYLIRCSSGADDNVHGIYRPCGTLLSSRTLLRTGGASDDTGSFGHVLNTFANPNNSQVSSFYYPFECLPLVSWNNKTATALTVKLYGISSATAMPDNGSVWMNVQYPQSSSSPLGAVESTRKATYSTTGTALTADTSAWDSKAPARANSTAYVVGNVVAASTNAGRLFICTTAGTSATAIPAGFATAVDGGSVTDGTAVFRAMFRFSITLTLSPQQALAGPVEVTPVVQTGATSVTTIFDPAPTLS